MVINGFYCSTILISLELAEKLDLGPPGSIENRGASSSVALFIDALQILKVLCALNNR